MNVSLKFVEEEDIESIRQWRNSDLINNVSFSIVHITPEMQRAWFEKISKENSSLNWIIMANENRVGYAAVKDIDISNRRCEFSSLYIGDTNFLNSGIGAVAEYLVIEYMYNNFNLQKIFCQVLETNPKVIQLHKKFGFEVEGILKSHYIKNEKDLSVCILSLFEEVWENKRSNLKKILFR